jgi:hypothetical protein
MTRTLALALIIVGLTSPTITTSAQTREEAVLWGSIQNSTNIEDYRAYLDAYPNGTFAPLARRRIANMEAETSAAKAAKAAEAVRTREVRREALVDSEWEGREYYTWGQWTGYRAATPDNPKAKFHTIALRLSENDQCLIDNQAPCSWSKTGSQVTVIVKKNKVDLLSACGGEHNLELRDGGAVLSGSFSAKRDCLGATFFVRLERKK